MKYLTFTIPCYNSEAYMERCIQSLLPGGNDVEIIIVNDGSSDGTEDIANYYEKEYPEIVRAVHKKNGGHGSGVNAGLELAEGLYFKVVDSDDWLAEDAYLELLNKIKTFYKQEQEMPDLFINDYIYDHLDEGYTHTMSYGNVFPEQTVCTWNDMHRFKPSQYLIMHALVFKTEVLRESGVRLPEHTFYVDNLFAYQPLPYVKRIYYMNQPLYHYYLGREDQSVNEEVLKKRIDQQIKVTDLVSRSVNLKKVKQEYPKLAVYMMRNISIMLSISSIHLLLIKTKEATAKRKAMWDRIHDYDRSMYYRLRCTTLSGFTYLPGRVGAALTVGGYRAARKIYQFQ